MNITTEKGAFDLTSDFTIQIDEKSPITNDIGSQSVPVTIPCTPKNAKITGHAQRIDLGVKTMAGDSSCVIQDGVYVRRGKVNIVSASKKDGITLNIGFDNSEAYSQWKQTPLNKLSVCPVRTFESVTALCDYMNLIYWGQEEDDDFSVFRVKIANPSVKDNNGNETYYPEYLNPIDNQGRLKRNARTENVVINNTLYSMSLPEGYGMTGFLRVWRVLELIFEEFGYTLTENPFKTNPELACVVILNNAADACVTNKLSYKDLMPTCTVEDFLKSIYARFGAVYTISTDTRIARVRLIRDIVNLTADKDYSQMVTDFPLITYTEPKQLRLSAKTSLEGAAVEVERFEDFVKDGKRRAFYTGLLGSVYQPLMQEKITGKWFRYNSETAAMKEVSSSFFVWDRKEKGMEYEDIASEDECVPIIYEELNYGSLPDVVPLYLTGAVHRYTDVKTSDDTKVTDEKDETPLAFLLALDMEHLPRSNAHLFGSSFPILPSGDRVKINGNDFSFALTWQFNDGLFVNFWKDYDAILRHANNQIEVDTRLNVQDIVGVDFLRPALIKGQRVMIDAFSYMLPSEKNIKVAFTFKTLRLIGPYDLESEQAIPPIDSLAGSLKWIMVSSNLEQLINEYMGDQESENTWSSQYSQQTCYVSIIRRDYTGYVKPEEDAEIIQDIPQEEGIERIKTYSVMVVFNFNYWYSEYGYGGYDEWGSDQWSEEVSRVFEYTVKYESRRL